MMIKYIFAAFGAGVLISFTSVASPVLVDSVGTVVKNGKSFILHKVAPKETIYALARQYGVPVAQLQQANPGVTGLTVGQTVLVPSRSASSSSESSPSVTKAKEVTTPVNPETSALPDNNAPAVSNEANNRVHQVEARQTLFAVSRLYNVSTTDLKKWNNLTSDNLQEGQTLVVAPPVAAVTANNSVAVATEETASSRVVDPGPATKPTIRREEPKTENMPLPAKESTPIKEERTETRVSESLSRISESGLAEVMEKAEGSKYLALHKTAPVGTILQVRNTLNNQSVYVRVSGKLPEGDVNDRVIIRVSKRAYQKLAATDNRFRVEVNYMP